jgi:hypothetical protein
VTGTTAGRYAARAAAGAPGCITRPSTDATLAQRLRADVWTSFSCFTGHPTAHVDLLTSCGSGPVLRRGRRSTPPRVARTPSRPARRRSGAGRRTVWLSRRIPTRSMSRHDRVLSAKQSAVTRRSSRTSKQIRSTSVTASVAIRDRWSRGAGRTRGRLARGGPSAWTDFSAMKELLSRRARRLGQHHRAFLARQQKVPGYPGWFHQLPERQTPRLARRGRRHRIARSDLAREGLALAAEGRRPPKKE